MKIGAWSGFCTCHRVSKQTSRKILTSATVPFAEADAKQIHASMNALTQPDCRCSFSWCFSNLKKVDLLKVAFC
eukprot:UN04685